MSDVIGIYNPFFCLLISGGIFCIVVCMYENILKFKVPAGIFTLIAVVVAGAAFFVNDQNLRKQAYEGKIIETYRTRNWLRGIKKPMDGKPKHRHYNHYWKIEDGSGQVRDVEVPHYTWSKGKTGTPVKKVTGERYPQVDTEAENQKRDVLERFF